MHIALLFADMASALALGVSTASVLYVRRGVRAAEASNMRDAQRRHDELTPRFEAKVESVGGWYRLVLALRSAQPLTYVEVELAGTDGVRFTTSQNGVDPSGRPPMLRAQACKRPDDGDDRHGVAGMEPGDSAKWRVVLANSQPRPPSSLRVVARSGHEEWVVPHVPVDVPLLGTEGVWPPT